jgi:hypothetical protein
MHPTSGLIFYFINQRFWKQVFQLSSISFIAVAIYLLPDLHNGCTYSNWATKKTQLNSFDSVVVRLFLKCLHKGRHVSISAFVCNLDFAQCIFYVQPKYLKLLEVILVLVK